MDEPTRFIFSHSALREGWDNPNVFQICTLKHSDNQTAKRQEVGRGLRLCVNQSGNRMDMESCGETVHDINLLTVIASESYKGFVSDLQSDIKTVLYDRPTVATSEYFNGKYVKVDGTPTLIDKTAADTIEFYLIQNGYVDKKRKVTDKYRTDVAMNTVAELPEELEPMAEGIHALIQAVYDDSVLDTMFSDGHETKIKDNPLNENFAKTEFQTLWKQINHKYTFLSRIQVLHKSSLNTLIGCTVCKYIVLYSFVCTKCLVKALGAFFHGEYFAAVFAIKLVIGNVLNNHCCLLFFNKPNYF